MTAHLPARLSDDDSIDSLLSALVDEPDSPPDTEEVTLDFSTLRFVEPAGVALLASTLEWLRRHGVRYELLVPADAEDEEPIRYLDDAGFFERYLGYQLSARASLRPTTRPLAFVRPAESYAWIQNTLVAWLAHALSMPPGALGIIGIGLGEVFNNVRDHSGVEGGCVFAQHFPRQQRVQIAVSDFGVGIPATVRRKEPDLDDPAALLRATDAGFSSQSVINNLGAGLDSLLTQVALANGGAVRIRSGAAALMAEAPDGAVLRTSAPMDTVYPGTLLRLDLRTDTFDPDEAEDESLNW